MAEVTTRRGVFAFILGAVAAAKLKPSPAWAAIMPPQPVATVEVDALLSARADYYAIEYPLRLRTYDWNVHADEVLAYCCPKEANLGPL